MVSLKQPPAITQPDSPIMLARLEYAARGWWTFPAPADGSKKSLKFACDETNYVNWGGSLDPEVIRAEFNGKRFNGRTLHDQNIGIMTGIQSGIFVIETDTAEHGDGIDGETSLKAQEKRNGALPKTLMACSPSGSIHRFFKHPGKGIKIKSRSGIFGKGCGVDCKGDGGMVIGVPSYRPPRPATADKPAKAGGLYEWVNAGHAIADAPRWLLDFVVEKPRVPRTTRTPEKSYDASLRANQPANRDLVRAALDQYSSNCHYDIWFETAAALHFEFGGSDVGFDLFDRWSAKSPQYREGECEAKWQAVAGIRGYSVGTIFFYAEKANPGWRAIYEAKRLAEACSFLRFRK